MKALKFNLVLICFVALFMSISFADWSAESEGYCDWGVPIHAKTCDTAYYCTTGVAAVDTATWADTVFGQVGWSGHCVDAYLDSVFGCSPVVFTTPVKIDSPLTLSGNLKVDTINSKTTNGNLLLLPNGSGRTQIGDAYSVSIQSLGNDDLYITGKLEVRGSVYFGDSMFIPQWAAAPATGSPGLFGADSTNDSLITFIGGTRAVVYPHPSVAAVDTATYADTVYGQVGKAGSCIDAYLDSVFGCSPVVFTTPVKIDSSLTVDIEAATADTVLYIKHYGSRTTDYGIVVDMDTSENTAADVIGIDFSGSNAFNNYGDNWLYMDADNRWRGDGYIYCDVLNLRLNALYFKGDYDMSFMHEHTKDIIFNWQATDKGDVICRDGNLGVVNADFFQIEDSAATDQFTISNEGKITLLDTVTYDLIAYEINAVDSLLIPQWAAAPGTGSSGLFGADTTNDSIIAFLGGTRAVIYPAAGGGGIAETLGVIEVDDTTFMTADNDTFRIVTEAIVKWEVDDVAYEKWFASEFKQISFGYDGKAIADYGSVWGGRGGYCSASYGTVVGGYLDSVKANWGFVAGGQNNKILTGTYSGIVSGQNNTVESGTHSCIVGGVNNKIDGGAGFIGGGTTNKIGNLSMYGGIVGGGNDSIGHGSINCFIGSGTYNYISKGGDYNAICGGGYNLIGDGSTDNYNFIGGGHYDTLFADYSGIISGRKNSIQSNCRHSFIGAGYANKIRGDVGDSCNAAFGAGSVVDTCLASFAMNCAIKKADSTFGFSKQIWVIEGTDTTKITAQGIDFTYEDPTIKRGYGIVSTDVVFDTGNVTIVTADDGWVVEDVWFEVTTTFDGDAVVTIGDAGDADGYLRDADINQGVVAYYGYESDERGDYLYDATNSHSRQKIYTSSTAIVIYVTQTTATQGAGTVYVGLKRLK